MADKFDEFLSEMENDLRAERYKKIWDKYGKLISSAVTGVLLLSAGWMMWNNHAEKQRLLTADMFFKAQDLLDQDKTSEAFGVLTSLMDGSETTYRLFASLLKATALFKEKDDAKNNEGFALLESLKKDGKASLLIKDLASYLMIKYQIDLIDKDDKKFQESAENWLKELENLSKENSPWCLFAKDLKGFILYKLGRLQEASETFVSILQSQKCPQGLRLRAELLNKKALSEMA